MNQHTASLSPEEVRILAQLSQVALKGGLRALWHEGLDWLQRGFDASGVSLIFLRPPIIQMRVGECNPSAQEHIERWETLLRTRLTQRETREETVVREEGVWRNGSVAVFHRLLWHNSHLRGGIALCFAADKVTEEAEQPRLTACIEAVLSLAILASAMEVAQERFGRLHHIHQVGQAISSNLDLKAVLKETTVLAATALNARASALMLIDEETDELVFRVPHGEKEELLREYRQPRSEGIAGWVATHGEPLIVNDVSQDPRFTRRVDAMTGFVTRSILCVPLQVKGRTIGVLEVLNKQDGTDFDQADQEWLSTIAAQAAIAVENARLYEDLREERDRIIQAQEAIRHTLARDLHDGPAQELTVIIQSIGVVRRALASRPDTVTTELDFLERLARSANRELRELLFELRPVVLETRGLVAALQFYFERLRLTESLKIEMQADPLPEPLDTAAASAVVGLNRCQVTRMSAISSKTFPLRRSCANPTLPRSFFRPSENISRKGSLDSGLG